MQTSEMFEVAAAVPLRERVCGVPFFSAHADLEAFAKMDMAAVYALGPVHGRGPHKVGWASRPDKRFNSIQAANWVELVAHEITWTAGPPLAKALQREIERILRKGGRQLRGDWYDVPVGLMLSTFDVAARNLLMETMTHDAMLDRFEAEKRRLLGRGLEKFGSRSAERQLH